LTALVEGCGFGQIEVHPTGAVDIQIIEAVKVAETVASAQTSARREAEPARVKVPAAPPVPATTRSALPAG
jgi:hypothetical protein